MPPGGVEDLGEAGEAEAAGGVVQTGEVEEDVSLHRGEEGEAGDLGGLVEELGAGNLAVGAFFAGAADDELDQVHLLDHVLEGAHVGVRHLATLGDVAQGVQVLQQVVGELVLGGLDDDALEVLGLDVAVAVLVEELEGLPDPLALQAAQHLGELLVVQVVALLLAPYVQLGPLAVPVEGDAVRALAELVELAEMVILDGSQAVDVEEAKRYLVLGVGFCEDVLEGGPVGEGDPAFGSPVGNSEEDRVLLAFDLVLL